MGRTNRVVIIEDEQIVLSMLVRWLEGLAGFSLAGQASNGIAGLELCVQVKPDIVLLDIGLSGMDGLDVARHLRRKIPETRVIMLTSHTDPYCVYEIARLGVWGYVNKAAPLDTLRSAVMHVADGKRYYVPVYQEIQKTVLSAPDAFYRILSPKQVAVLMLVSQGCEDSVIAERLGISPMTVATHRRNLRTKLNAHNNNDLIRYARKWGLTPLVEGPEPVL